MPHAHAGHVHVVGCFRFHILARRGEMSFWSSICWSRRRPLRYSYNFDRFGRSRRRSYRRSPPPAFAGPPAARGSRAEHNIFYISGRGARRCGHAPSHSHCDLCAHVRTPGRSLCTRRYSRKRRIVDVQRRSSRKRTIRACPPGPLLFGDGLSLWPVGVVARPTWPIAHLLRYTYFRELCRCELSRHSVPGEFLVGAVTDVGHFNFYVGIHQLLRTVTYVKVETLLSFYVN